MRLSVLGATGPTGQLVVSEALEEGHDVIALVRNPDKLAVSHERLTIVKADLADSANLTEHFRGCDAILSAVGGKPGISTPCDVYTMTGKAAIAAMREAGVARLVCVTAWGTKDDPNLPYEWRFTIKPTCLKNVISNMEELEDYLLSDCPNINYTVVRPPQLVNTPSSEKALLVSEGQVPQGYEKARLSRADLAKFMLSCLHTSTHDRKMVAITTS